MKSSQVLKKKTNNVFTEINDKNHEQELLVYIYK